MVYAEGSGGGAVDLADAVPARQSVLLPLATDLWTLFGPCADVGCAAAIVNAFVAGTTAPFAAVAVARRSRRNAAVQR